MGLPALDDGGNNQTLLEGEAVKHSADDIRKWFNEAVNVHYHGLLKFATRVTGNRDAAKDAVHQAILDAERRGFGNYDDSRPLRPFLIGCVRNALRTNWRKASRSNETSLDRMRDDGSTRETVAATGFGNTAAYAKSLSSIQALSAAVESLSEPDRKLLALLRDPNYEEIAETVGCAAGALKVRISRMRSRLRTLLKGKKDL